MDKNSTGTDNPPRDAQLMLKAIRFANLMNESALHYRNWKDAEKSLEQATNEYDRGKPHFQNFPILKERLEKKKSIAEKGLSTTKATHDIKAKILTDCCRDLLSDRLNIRDIEDIVVTAREVIRGRDLQVNEEKLLDQSRAYIDTALTRARPTSQVDLSEIHAELQRLRIITERQDATIKEQQDSIVKMVTKHNGEIELLKKEFQETSSSSRSQISTMTGIVQGVKTEIHQQRTTTDESFLKVVSSVDDKIQKLVADMQELRVVCDRFGGFDKVSYELQSTVTSQNIDELRETTQRHTEALLQAEKVLNEHREYFNNSNNNNISSSQEESRNIPPSSQSGTEAHSLPGLDPTALQDLETRVSATERKLSEHQGQVHEETQSMHGTIDQITTNMKESITETIKSIYDHIGRLDALITPLIEEKPVDPIASLQPPYQEQFRLIDTRYDAAIKSLIHLNKRIDDFSVDNVVTKINMQIRNVNHEHLQNLTTDLRKLRESIGMTDATGIRPLDQPLIPGLVMGLNKMTLEVEALKSSLTRMNEAWGLRADNMGHKIDSIIGARG